MLCTIEADLSRIVVTRYIDKAKKRKGWFYRVDYDNILLFGMTELKAQVIWMESSYVVQSNRYGINFTLGL